MEADCRLHPRGVSLRASRVIVAAADIRFVKATSFRYITDAITKEEALALLKEKEATKKAREEEVIKRGYPAYTTSVGWLGESRPFLQYSPRSNKQATPTRRSDD